MPTKPKNNLIKVRKDGDEIEISPLTLDNHLALGWTVVDAQPEMKPAAKEPEEEPGV